MNIFNTVLFSHDFYFSHFNVELALIWIDIDA